MLRFLILWFDVYYIPVSLPFFRYSHIPYCTLYVIFSQFFNIKLYIIHFWLFAFQFWKCQVTYLKAHRLFCHVQCYYLLNRAFVISIAVFLFLVSTFPFIFPSLCLAHPSILAYYRLNPLALLDYESIVILNSHLIIPNYFGI